MSIELRRTPIDVPGNNLYLLDLAGDPSVSPGFDAGVGSIARQWDSTTQPGATFIKTGTGATNWVPIFNDVRIDDGDSSTALTINFAAGRIHKAKLTGDCTLTFTAPTGPCVLTLELAQDATGTRVVTWPSTVHWSGGTAPTLTTTVNKVDVFTLYFNGTHYFGATAGLNYTA